MNEVKKEIVEMLEKFKSFILCSDGTTDSCPDENDDSDCYDCDKNALDQATTEIMDIMDKENDEEIENYSNRERVLEKKCREQDKEIKQLMVFIKQTGAVQDQDGNWECTECEPVEETKRLRKELEQALKGK